MTCFEMGTCTTCSKCLSLWAVVTAPCFYLGLMESLILREEQKCCNNLGVQGFTEALLTSLLTIIGWPCPFLLICYVHRKKQNYRMIYDDHSDLATSKFTDSSSICLLKLGDLLRSCCLWPCNVLQLHNFLVEKDKHGLLRFEWAESSMVLDDLKSPKNAAKTQKVAIIGSQGCGKTVLLHKLLSASSTNDVVFSSEKSHGGIKTIFHSDLENPYISVLEVWEISENEFNSEYFLTQMIKTFDVIIFVYDLSDLSKKSFADLKLYFEKSIHNVSVHQHIIILANRLDMCHNDNKQKLLDLKTIEPRYLDVYSTVNRWIAEEASQLSLLELKQHIAISSLDVDAIKKLRTTIHSILDKHDQD